VHMERDMIFGYKHERMLEFLTGKKRTFDTLYVSRDTLGHDVYEKVIKPMIVLREREPVTNEMILKGGAAKIVKDLGLDINTPEGFARFKQELLKLFRAEMERTKFASDEESVLHERFVKAVESTWQLMDDSGLLKHKKLRFIDTCCLGGIPLFMEMVLGYKNSGVETSSVLGEHSDLVSKQMEVPFSLASLELDEYMPVSYGAERTFRVGNPEKMLREYALELLLFKQAVEDELDIRAQRRLYYVYTGKLESVKEYSLVGADNQLYNVLETPDVEIDIAESAGTENEVALKLAEKLKAEALLAYIATSDAKTGIMTIHGAVAPKLVLRINPTYVQQIRGVKQIHPYLQNFVNILKNYQDAIARKKSKEEINGLRKELESVLAEIQARDPEALKVYTRQGTKESLSVTMLNSIEAVVSEVSAEETPLFRQRVFERIVSEQKKITAGAEKRVLAETRELVRSGRMTSAEQLARVQRAKDEAPIVQPVEAHVSRKPVLDPSDVDAMSTMVVRLPDGTFQDVNVVISVFREAGKVKTSFVFSQQTPLGVKPEPAIPLAGLDVSDSPPSAAASGSQPAQYDLKDFEKVGILEGTVGTHPLEIWKHKASGVKVVVKSGPSHSLRADFVGQRVFSLLGLPVIPTSLSTHPETGKLVLVTKFAEDYKGNTEKGWTREFLGDDYFDILKHGILADVWLQQYDRVYYNVMVSKDGKGLLFIDWGAALTSRARGGYKGFTDYVDDKIVREALSDPYDINKFVDNPAYEEAFNDPVYMGSLAEQLSSVTDAQIDAIIDAANYPAPQEAKARIDSIIGELEAKVNRYTPGSLDYVKTESAINTYKKIRDEFNYDEAAYIKHALKSRRNGLVMMFPADAGKRRPAPVAIDKKVLEQILVGEPTADELSRSLMEQASRLPDYSEGPDAMFFEMVRFAVNAQVLSVNDIRLLARIRAQALHHIISFEDAAKLVSRVNSEMALLAKEIAFAAQELEKIVKQGYAPVILTSAGSILNALETSENGISLYFNREMLGPHLATVEKILSDAKKSVGSADYPTVISEFKRRLLDEMSANPSFAEFNRVMFTDYVYPELHVKGALADGKVVFVDACCGELPLYLEALFDMYGDDFRKFETRSFLYSTDLTGPVGYKSGAIDHSIDDLLTTAEYDSSSSPTAPAVIPKSPEDQLVGFVRQLFVQNAALQAAQQTEVRRRIDVKEFTGDARALFRNFADEPISVGMPMYGAGGLQVTLVDDDAVSISRNGEELTVLIGGERAVFDGYEVTFAQGYLATTHQETPEATAEIVVYRVYEGPPAVEAPTAPAPTLTPEESAAVDEFVGKLSQEGITREDVLTYLEHSKKAWTVYPGSIDDKIIGIEATVFGEEILIYAERYYVLLNEAARRLSEKALPSVEAPIPLLVVVDYEEVEKQLNKLYGSISQDNVNAVLNVLLKVRGQKIDRKGAEKEISAILSSLTMPVSWSPQLYDDVIGELISDAKQGFVEAPPTKVMPAPSGSALLEALAMEYLYSSGGKDVVWKGASLEDIINLLSDPDKFVASGKFGLKADDAENIKDWIDYAKKAELSKEQFYKTIRQKYSENPLFKEELSAPEGFVSVYHKTSEGALSGLAEKGLVPMPPAYKMDADKLFDKFAPAGFSRSNSVYGADNPHSPSLAMGKGRVILELKVDPKKVLVTDAEMFTEGNVAYGKSNIEGAENWAQRYWERSMTLEEFLNLPLEDRLNKFNFPEIIIPQGVRPEMMRVLPPAGVTPEASAQKGPTGSFIENVQGGNVQSLLAMALVIIAVLGLIFAFRPRKKDELDDKLENLRKQLEDLRK